MAKPHKILLFNLCYVVRPGNFCSNYSTCHKRYNEKIYYLNMMFFAIHQLAIIIFIVSIDLLGYKCFRIYKIDKNCLINDLWLAQSQIDKPLDVVTRSMNIDYTDMFTFFNLRFLSKLLKKYADTRRFRIRLIVYWVTNNISNLYENYK